MRKCAAHLPRYHSRAAPTLCLLGRVVVRDGYVASQLSRPGVRRRGCWQCPRPAVSAGLAAPGTGRPAAASAAVSLQNSWQWPQQLVLLHRAGLLHTWAGRLLTSLLLPLLLRLLWLAVVTVAWSRSGPG